MQKSKPVMAVYWGKNQQALEVRGLIQGLRYLVNNGSECICNNRNVILTVQWHQLT